MVIISEIRKLQLGKHGSYQITIPKYYVRTLDWRAKMDLSLELLSVGGIILKEPEPLRI